MSGALKDFALPLLIILLGAGGLGSLLVSRLVPQRRSPEEKIADHETRIRDLEAKVALRDETINKKDEIIGEKDATIKVQSDYILDLRTWGIDGANPPVPAWPDNLKIR